MEPSILDVATAAQSAADSAASAASAANPCAGSQNSPTIIKSTTSTSYDRGTKSSGLYPNIGSKTVTKTACDGITTYTTTEQDSCVEIAKPSGVCTGATSAYLRCYNDQVSSDKIYYVCQDLGSGNNSLANKINSKADASAVTASALATTLGSTFLKPTDSISASNLTGTIDAGRLPDSVVTTGDDATHGLNTLLSNALGNAGPLKDVVTSGTLDGYVKTSGTDSNSISNVLSSNNVVTATSFETQTLNFGKDGNNNDITLTLGEIVDLLRGAAGTCTQTEENGKTTTRCSGGNLGTVSASRQ